ncbi:MAG TPA: hypothetical protein VFU89_07285 [Rhabdochlamydiaceae bacterium]|nr:hypothetical protein [Rhabdochlamydiaceae bacterium]
MIEPCFGKQLRSAALSKRRVLKKTVWSCIVGQKGGESMQKLAKNIRRFDFIHIDFFEDIERASIKDHSLRAVFELVPDSGKLIDRQNISIKSGLIKNKIELQFP